MSVLCRWMHCPFSTKEAVHKALQQEFHMATSLGTKAKTAQLLLEVYSAIFSPCGE